MSEPATKTPRWMRYTLIASLAANLLVAGVFVGAAFTDAPKRPPPREQSVPGDLRGIARAMPETGRQTLRGAIARRPEMGGERRRMIQENRMRFVEALEADPFDLETIRQIFAAQHEAFSATTLDGQAALLEAIESMSAQERATFATNLRNAKPPRRR